MLAVWTGDDGKTHLGITGARGRSWHVLHTWEATDPDAPARYVGDGELQCNGGPTASIIAESSAVLRVALTE